jgi:hypothetical protein
MKLKENIYQSIKKMNNDELVLLYEQIKLLEQLRSFSISQEASIPLEQIHEMTGSSKSNWANSVIEDRMERLC